MSIAAHGAYISALVFLFLWYRLDIRSYRNLVDRLKKEILRRSIHPSMQNESITAHIKRDSGTYRESGRVSLHFTTKAGERRSIASFSMPEAEAAKLAQALQSPLGTELPLSGLAYDSDPDEVASNDAVQRESAS